MHIDLKLEQFSKLTNKYINKEIYNLLIILSFKSFFKDKNVVKMAKIKQFWYLKWEYLLVFVVT